MAQRRRSRSAPGPRTGPAHHLDLNLATARRSALAAFERVYVVRQLRRHGGDVEKTAARTGISPGTLRALIARHDIDRTEYVSPSRPRLVVLRRGGDDR